MASEIVTYRFLQLIIVNKPLHAAILDDQGRRSSIRGARRSGTHAHLHVHQGCSQRARQGEMEGGYPPPLLLTSANIL